MGTDDQHVGHLPLSVPEILFVQNIQLEIIVAARHVHTILSFVVIRPGEEKRGAGGRESPQGAGAENKNAVQDMESLHSVRKKSYAHPAQHK